MLALLVVCALDTAEVRYVTVAPAESIRVVSVGEGEPVVLIPGLFGSAYGYRGVSNLLGARGYRAIVVEPLGLGRSSRPKGADYSLSAQADRIAAVLDTLRLDSVLLVAHSVGGTIALRLAYGHPGAVRGVVSIESGFVESATTPTFRRAMALASVLKRMNASALVAQFIAHEMRAASADTSWITPDVLRSYTAEVLENFGATLDVYRAMARATEPELLADHLSKIRAPVLVLLGATRHNGAPAERELVLLQELLPHVAIEHVPGAGHFIHEEQSEVVLAAVLRVGRLADDAHALSMRR